MQQHIGMNEFLQGCLKGGDEVGGEVSNEPNGVGQDKLLLVWETQAPCRWV